MGAWPELRAANGLLGGDTLAIGPTHPLALGGYGIQLGSTGGAAWPAANRAIFYPLRVGRPTRLGRLWVFNGATPSGNFDLGVYDKNGNRLVSTGSTAQAGVSAMQVLTPGTALVPAQEYVYLALAFDNAVALVNRLAPTLVQALQMGGCAQMDAAFPLPAVATLASLGTAYLPYFGAFGRSAP
jgi:hypothetical protein